MEQHPRTSGVCSTGHTRQRALMQSDVRRCAVYPAGHAEGCAHTFMQLFQGVYEHIGSGARRAFPTVADRHRQMVLAEAVGGSAASGDG